MLCLSSHGRNMSLTFRCFFFRPRTLVDPTLATVVADPVHRGVVDHGGVVGVVNVGNVYVVHCAVVEEAPIVPAPAFIAVTEVAEAVADAAVETYVQTPVAFMENKSVAAPTPPGWSPEETGFRRHYPRTRHPIVAVGAIGPKAGRPNVALGRARGLLIHGQRWRADRN